MSLSPIIIELPLVNVVSGPDDLAFAMSPTAFDISFIAEGVFAIDDSLAGLLLTVTPSPSHPPFMVLLSQILISVSDLVEVLHVVLGDLADAILVEV